MSELQNISDVIPIEEVIGDYVDLKKRGVNYIGLCPFHKEKTPSFTLSPTRKIFKCFGCGKAGNVLSFIMEVENLSQSEAVNFLLKKYLKGEKVNLEDYSTKHQFKSYVEDTLIHFENNLKEIQELIEFDKILIDLCTIHLIKLEERLKNIPGFPITNPSLLPSNTIKQLERIKENESLGKKYQTIYNQSLVLLVSYFTHAVQDIFKNIVTYYIDHKDGAFEKVNEDIKISLVELEDMNYEVKSNLGELIIQKRKISFQDMQSTCTAFKQFLNINLDGIESMHNVILGQAARHSIIHSLALADKKFMAQISFANNRNLKKEINLGDDIQFDKNEIKVLLRDMKAFINDILIRIE